MIKYYLNYVTRQSTKEAPTMSERLSAKLSP